MYEMWLVSELADKGNLLDAVNAGLLAEDTPYGRDMVSGCIGPPLLDPAVQLFCEQHQNWLSACCSLPSCSACWTLRGGWSTCTAATSCMAT
jgi:hypothetical protein